MAIEYRTRDKCRLIVYTGSDAYGKPIRHIKTVTYTSKRNAEKQYREFEHEVLAENEPKDSGIRLLEMIDGYIASRERKGVRSSTIYGYAEIRTRIDKTLGNPVARRVTPKMIDDWIGKLDTEYNYSSRTIKNTVHFLSSCYARYIDLEQLQKNPCRKAEVPDKPGKPRVILSADTIIPFYEALQEEKDIAFDYVVAIELCLFCGLRRSELAGLREQNIDMINRAVKIEHTRHRLRGVDIENEGTKTERSARTLCLPDFVFDDITGLISSHNKRALKGQHTDYLILDYWGEPIVPGAVYMWLKRFEERHGLPKVTLHGLRHTYASLLKYVGRDLTEISGQLGHSQQSTTLNIYTHLFRDATIISRNIATELNELIAQNG